MGKIDPRLRYLISQSADPPSESNAPIAQTEEELGFSEFTEPIRSFGERPKVSGQQQPPYKVAVLVRCKRNFDLESLQKAGMNVYSHIKGFYTVVSGEVLISDLDKLKELEFVVEVEAPRPMMLEELDISREAIGAKAVEDYDLPVKGQGVIVGIIDTGLDYTHTSFRHQDGTSRILYLWDQKSLSHNGQVPYGREYTQAQINQALINNPQPRFDDSDPQIDEQVPRIDKDGHGTHVAGIAVGNGVVSQGNYAGIAPQADLIVVALREESLKNQSEGRITLGNSVTALDALAYILQRAKEQGCPVAINISLGTNAGGHSGETDLETAINEAVRQPNVVIVKSAGNEQERRIHAGGKITKNEEVILELEVPDFHRRTYLELWYENSKSQSISLALHSPTGEIIDVFVNSDATIKHTSRKGKITIDIDYNAKNTGDTLISIILEGNIEPRNWQLRLRENEETEGRYDIWIDNTYNVRNSIFHTRFTESCADHSRKITIPGNAKGIITVGSYVTRHRDGYISQPIGRISSFSSFGPTRYELQKPEITAPGEWIISARSTQCYQSPDPDQRHTTLRGTSMAAPHVTGVAALILSVCPGLTCEQVKQVLMKTALSDQFTSTIPNHTWGHGKLNVQEAVEIASRCANNFLFPKIRNVQINRERLSWETDVPTTGIVRFHTQENKLRLGKFLESKEDNILTHNHTFTLSELSPGETYYCEIEAISEDGWSTLDDNVQQDGFAEFYQLTIPENGD